MKTGTCILTLWLAASAWAQTPKPAAAAAKPGAPRLAAMAVTSKAAAAKPQPGKASAMKAGADPLAAKSETGAEKKTVAAKAGHKGQRDPFVSPIVERPAASAPVCTGTGRRCLFTGEVSLQGIVESDNGVIAVVVSGGHTYFLREHDTLADGEVEKITKTTMTLRQRTTDMAGRSVVKEITRKLEPAV